MLKWLYDKIAPRGLTTKLTDEDSQSAAKLAVVNAEAGYNDVVARTERIDEVVTKLQDQRERNHFAYLLEKTMRGAG